MPVDQSKSQAEALPAAHIRVASVAEMLALAPPDTQSWLSPTEWQRSQRLLAPQRREHYLAGHWLLRVLLGETSDAQMDQYEILDRPSLPPQIAERPDLHLSLSHSGPWIAGAVSTQPIGIDLEQRRSRQSLASFEQLLRNHDEAPGSLDLDALLQRWVVKEAFIKRDCGSALPERLAQLSLNSSEDPADVCLWHTEQFLLGTTDPQTTPITPPCESGDGVRLLRHWRIVDSGIARS